jgi:hypothetical protein
MKNEKFNHFATKTFAGQAFVFIICKLYTFTMAGYCLIPFVYLSFHKWFAIYKKFYFIGHFVILPMPIWSILIKKVIKMYFPVDKKEELKNAESNAAKKVN